MEGINTEVQEEILDTEVVVDTTQEPKWLPARLERHAKKAVKDLLAELKLKDKEELVSKLELVDKLNNELEELKKNVSTQQTTIVDDTQVKELQKQLNDLTSQLKSEKEANIQGTVKTRISEYAASIKALHPTDVVNFVMSDKKYQDFLLEDGSVNADKIKEVVDKAKTDRPNYFKSLNPGVPSNFTGNDKPNEDIVKKQYEINNRQIAKSF